MSQRQSRPYADLLEDDAVAICLIPVELNSLEEEAPFNDEDI